ncbi:hypothetical protein RUND412_003637 [Rhizina undulata]
MPPTRPFLRPVIQLVCRAYSTQSPLIHVQSIPAPHVGSIKVLTLNRPTAKNAISLALLAELRSYVEEIHSGKDMDTRALVIGSEVDGVFCAGADLKERAGFTKTQTDAFLTSLRSTLKTLSSLPIPTLSAISSLALGGGLELALATDLRIVSPRAQLGLPETRLGIIPGAGGTYRLPRLIGEARAKDLILTGRRVGAIEAVQIGLANRIVDIDEEGEGRIKTIDATIEVAQEICFGAPIAIKIAKAAVEGAREEVENGLYEKVVGTEDRNEALSAFRERRIPSFKGR